MSKETPDKDSHPWAFYYKETKHNISNINESLFTQIQKLEKENAIEELSTDNREKDQSLEDSHKIITRLNEEYTVLMREFTSLEKYTKDIKTDYENCRKTTDNITKTSYTDKIQKQNENLKNENEKLKKEFSQIKELKKLNHSKTSDCTRLEKELSDKTQNLNEIKSEFENFEKILREKNKIISQLEDTLEEANSNLSTKEEEFKLLIKLSQELGSENKSNVEEMTKQAVNTIKLFYNTMKVSTGCEKLNMSELSSTNSSVVSKNAVNTNTYTNINTNQREFPGKTSPINNKVHTVPNIHEEEKSFLSKKEIEAMLREKKASFLLEDALTTGIRQDSNNHIMNLNFKNELLKCELFASLIREMNFVNYLSESNLSKLKFEPDNNNLLLLQEIKEFFDKMKISCEENVLLEKENQTLRENNSRLELLTIKLKDNTKSLIQKMKQRFDSLDKSLSENLNHTVCEEKIEKFEKIVQKSNNELKSKNEEIKRLLVDNENLNATIDNVKKENLSIMKKEKSKISKIPKNNNSNTLNKIESVWKFEIILYKKEISNKENELRLNLEKNHSFMNISKNSIESSFREKKYKLKKEENLNLKLEIENLKSELSRAVKKEKDSKFNNSLKNLPSLKIDKENKISIEYPQNFDKKSKNNFSCEQCLQFKILEENFLEFKTKFIKASTFKDLKQFYIGYEMDIEKLNTKLDEVSSTIKNTDNEFSYENSEKKIKATQIREILSQLQKLTTILYLFINKYKKDLHFFTNNLKKVFDFMQKIVYGNSFLNTFGSEILCNNERNDFQYNSANYMNNNFLPYGTNKIKEISPNIISQKILILIYELNDKTFSRSELKKIQLAYENRSVKEIIEIFKFNCEVVKNNMISGNNFETEISQFEDEFVKLENIYYSNSNLNQNNSFKTVNDRLLKLKKTEFDLMNLTEVIKNFLVVQEILIKILFYNLESKNLENDLANFENSKKNRIDILENIFYIMEETIFYKCGECDENLFFIKKFVLGLLKNQKRILQITFEKLD